MPRYYHHPRHRRGLGLAEPGPPAPGVDDHRLDDEAERLVFERVTAALGAPARIYPNVRWVDHPRPGGPARDGETDLLIVDPDRGLLAIEIKGGTVSRDGFGRWYAGTRHLDKVAVQASRDGEVGNRPQDRRGTWRSERRSVREVTPVAQNPDQSHEPSAWRTRMPGSTETLFDLLEQAHEADLGSRIEWRDLIAVHGTEAVREIRPWLADPSTVSFAIRVIERAAATNAEARHLAIDALRAVRGDAFSEPARRDAEEALKRLGVTSRTSQSPRPATRPTMTDPIPALIRGHLYRRRDLRAAGLLGNLYSGISYPADGDHVCLFSGGENGESYGYRDMPSGDNRYRYYGEWRGTRDMSLTGGNRAVLDRSPNIYLFVNNGAAQHRFEGRFMAIEHEQVAAEREGTIGEAIVFTLERVADEVRL